MINRIKNYILHLREKENLHVTLHPLERQNLVFSSELITFNIHDNPYCIFIKTNPQAFKHCLDCQKKVFEKCKSGSFCGTCYAGVKEYVYPLLSNDLPIGFISVSGYADESGESYIRSVSKTFLLPKQSLYNAYRSLHTSLPDKKCVDTLIAPLQSMLELAYIKRSCTVTSTLIEKVIGYLRAHHCEKITSKQLCDVFYCSRSQLAHLFKQTTGKSIPQYVNDLRIDDAKQLLTYTNVSITEIAYAVGYSDRNYFSTLFTEKLSMSPQEYRALKKRQP